MFRKMPLVMLASIAFLGICCQWLPVYIQSILYGISLSLKSVILFTLPFLIFGLLFQTSTKLAKQASKWILLILAVVCISNFTSTILSYFIGSLAYRLDLSMPQPEELKALIPIGNFSLPMLISNSQAMIAALVSGILCGWITPSWAQKVSPILEKMTATLLKGILFIIPLFILGFVVKIAHEQMISLILQSYSIIFLLIALSVFTYIGLIYLGVNGFQRTACIQSIKNMLPAALAGFGSMSSAAAMPLTILGSQKNSKNPDVTKSIIPMTVNIHLIGDCFAIPIFAFAIMKMFGLPSPDFSTYLLFASYFVLAKFSVAAVPGGGVLVMLPILENYLGFSGEMLSLITALYILFDPVTTAANILGNGGVAIGIGNSIKEKVENKSAA